MELMVSLIGSGVWDGAKHSIWEPLHRSFCSTRRWSRARAASRVNIDKSSRQAEMNDTAYSGNLVTFSKVPKGVEL